MRFILSERVAGFYFSLRGLMGLPTISVPGSMKTADSTFLVPAFAYVGVPRVHDYLCFHGDAENNPKDSLNPC